MNYTDRGLAIADMTTGVDVKGLSTYKETLRAKVLTAVSIKINDVSAIESALNSAWQGESRDAFDALFKEKREAIIADLEAEYRDIENRLDELANDYLSQDKALLAALGQK